MIYNKKDILKKLKDKYEKSQENSEVFKYISEYSKTEESLLAYDFIGLNVDNLGEFLSRSEPSLVFPEELLVVDDGEDTGVITVEMLNSLKIRDVLDLFLKNNEKEFKIRQSILEVSEKRKEFESSMNQLVSDYVNKMNSEVSRILLGEMRDNRIYLINCEENESALVFDGKNQVEEGSTWDFHPYCRGLMTYKKIKLGDYNGVGSLASILSAGLKKKIVSVNVDRKDFNILRGVGYTFKSEKIVVEKLGSLCYKEKLKVKQQKFENKNPTINEMVEILTLKYGKSLFKEKNNSNLDTISIKKDYFYSYELEDFLIKYNWCVFDMLQDIVILKKGILK